MGPRGRSEHRQPGGDGPGFFADGSLIVRMAAHSRTEDRVVIWNKEGRSSTVPYELHLHAVSFVGDSRHLFVVTESDVLLIRLPK